MSSELRHHAPLRPLVFLIFGGLLACVGLGPNALPTAIAMPQEPESESVSADSGGGASEPEPTWSETTDSAGWMASVDELFGVYVVSRIEAVLFFDFGTKEWLGTSIPFVVVWLLFGGVFLTLRMGFINFRAARHAIDLVRGKYDDPSHEGEVSHFQALAAALSATVGLGNIAGVAIAIGTGGPGACLWIVLIGLLGMTAKFTECTLGQLYRTEDASGQIVGGPMRYLRLGLADIGLAPLGKFLAVAFMVLCIGASFGGGNAFQVGQSLEAIQADVPGLQSVPWVYGIVMAVAVGVVIIGGMKSIGKVAGRIVPVMCCAYVVAALYILCRNYDQIPSALVTIVTQAFNPDAVYGGFLGVLVIGIKRAVFSNEAGIGSAAIAHAAAKTEEPVSEGIVALLEPFIDTVTVCTITALLVVVTGAHLAPETAVDKIVFQPGTAEITSASVEQLDELAAVMNLNTHTNLEVRIPDASPLTGSRSNAIRETLLKAGIKKNRFAVIKPNPDEQPDPGEQLASEDTAEPPTPVVAFPVAVEVAKTEGARLTVRAFVKGGHSWFRYVLYVAVVLFAYSTCISWSYYGERCWVQLFGVRSSLAYKGLFLGFTVLGSIVTRGNILLFSDLMLLGMSFPNLLGVLLLSGMVKRRLDDYWGRYQAGELKTFDSP